MKKIIIICVTLLGISHLSAQMRRGFGLTTGTQGSGIHFAGDWQLKDEMIAGFELRFFDIKNETELPVYNPYTGEQFNVGDKALIMFPMFGTIRWLPFEGKIANNFSPFVQAKLGPILAIDGNEEHRSFKNRWRKAPTIFTYGGQLVMGASFRQMSGSAISASIGYEFLPMGQTVDDKNNYDGMAINITWTFGLKRR